MILNTDGGARGNPGPGAAGIILRNDDGIIVGQFGVRLGVCTNNEAEYNALIIGLKTALDHKAATLTCNLDSELVVRQLNGEYRVKNARIKKLFDEAVGLKPCFERISFNHVQRSENRLADKLVNEVLDS